MKIRVGIKRNKLSNHNPFKWLQKRKHEFMASVHNNSCIGTMEKIFVTSLKFFNRFNFQLVR